MTSNLVLSLLPLRGRGEGGEGKGEAASTAGKASKKKSPGLIGLVLSCAVSGAVCLCAVLLREECLFVNDR